MKLSDLRNNFPEYLDMDDDELLEAVYESAYSDMEWEEFIEEVTDKPDDDKFGPIIDVLTEMKDLIATQEKPSDYTERFKLLEKAIRDLAEVVTAVKPPIVNVEAPIVNVPTVKVPKIEIPKIEVPPAQVTVEAPIIEIPQQNINYPEPITEWKFTVVRDRNGYIQDVVAKAN